MPNVAAGYVLPESARDNWLATVGRLRLRRHELGLTLAQASQRVNRCEAWTESVEAWDPSRPTTKVRSSHTPSPKLATLQLWGRAVGLRVCVAPQGFWEWDWSGEPEMLWLWGVSESPLRPAVDQDEFHRMWLIAACKAWRVQHLVDADWLARELGGAGRNTLWQWERAAADPLVFRLYRHWELMGAPMSLELREVDCVAG